jgi:prevent-host-death family protein
MHVYVHVHTSTVKSQRVWSGLVWSDTIDVEVLMMQVTTVTEAKAQLSRLLERVEQGERVVIGRAGKPVAVLVPYVHDPSPRTLGGDWEGRVEIADDVDDLPDWFLDHFDGPA